MVNYSAFVLLRKHVCRVFRPTTPVKHVLGESLPGILQKYLNNYSHLFSAIIWGEGEVFLLLFVNL